MSLNAFATLPRVVASEGDPKARGVQIFYENQGWDRSINDLLRFPAPSGERSQPTDLLQALRGVWKRSDETQKEHPDAIVYAFENTEAELLPRQFSDIAATAITFPDGQRSTAFSMTSAVFSWMRHWTRKNNSEYGKLVQGLVKGVKDPMAYRSRDAFEEYTRAAILADSLPAAAARFVNPHLYDDSHPPTAICLLKDLPPVQKCRSMTIPKGFKGDVYVIGSESLLKWGANNRPLQDLVRRGFLPNPVTLVGAKVHLDARFEQPPDFQTIQEGAILRARQGFEQQPYALRSIGVQSGYIMMNNTYFEVTYTLIIDWLGGVSGEWSVMVPLPYWLVRETQDSNSTISTVVRRYGAIDPVSFVTKGLNRSDTIEKVFLGAMLPYIFPERNAPPVQALLNSIRTV